MDYRFATVDDSGTLALLNQALIRDEGHRNPMTLAELQARMSAWLAGGAYQAVLVEETSAPAGYALFRREPEHVYLRQFFVRPDCRRRGVGRRAVAWLQENAWRGCGGIRAEVLVTNDAGLAFWRAVGFQDYCLTLELVS